MLIVYITLYMLIGWGAAGIAVFMAHQNLKYAFPIGMWLPVAIEASIALVAILVGLRFWSLL